MATVTVDDFKSDKVSKKEAIAFLQENATVQVRDCNSLKLAFVLCRGASLDIDYYNLQHTCRFLVGQSVYIYIFLKIHCTWFVTQYHNVSIQFKAFTNG